MTKDSDRSRAGYHHGDLRRRLIEVGEQLIEERGVEGFTLRECAKRAGVSPSAPSHHFGNATGLLTAIATAGFDGLTAAQETALADCGEARGDRIRAIGRAYICYAVGHPARFRAMFGHLPLNKNDPELAAAGFRALDVLRRELRELCGDGRVSETAAVALTWAAVHGYAQLLIDRRLPIIEPGLDQSAFLGDMADKFLNLISKALETD